jgi:glycosyltransferase involved in cell wall biosynthesis
MRLAVICDYPEEGWPSMDLCAQMLVTYLQQEYSDQLEVTAICPPFQRRCQNLPGIGRSRFAFNGDRLLNRFWDYPRYLSRYSEDFDCFHVSDQTYAQLIHVLPPERTGVFCHDLDTFRSVLEPVQELRPAWYRAMSTHILKGLQKAALVFHTTHSVRKQIESYQLVPPVKLVQAPLGVAVEYLSQDQRSLDWMPQLETTCFILHVGSCIPRKRMDVLLNVFAQLHQQYPDLLLVKVSGAWSRDQQAQIAQLELGGQIIHLQNLRREQIAALYQKAAAVLLTSEAEGFGLPVIEALACGAVVVASNLPVLQEVGGNAVIYCPVGDISTWVEAVTQVLNRSQVIPEPSERQQQAAKYSWSVHADAIAQAYLKLWHP